MTNCINYIKNQEYGRKFTLQKTFTQVVGKRRKCRPKLRWLDDVLQDFKEVGVTAW
jgi:hypothetical protein